MLHHTETGKKKIQGNWIVPLFLVLLILALFIPLRDALIINDFRTGKTLKVLPVKEGESFSIRYTHSVNLSDVTDTLEWTDNKLVLRTSLFTSFGAGIPVPADGIGTSITNTEDGFLLSGIDKEQKDNGLLVMLQEVPNHRLLYRDREIPLLDIAPSGTLLQLKIRNASLCELALFD